MRQCMKMFARLSRVIPEDLAAQYPDVLMDPGEHAQLFKAKYAGVYGYDLPDRVEAMRTEQWGDLDLSTVLPCETYIDMADIVRIKQICVEAVAEDDGEHILINRVPLLPVFKRPFIGPEGWNQDCGLFSITERKPGDRWYCPIVFNKCRSSQSDARSRETEHLLKHANEDGDVFDGAPPARPLPDICYTVEWRCGAVTLMPIDLVKVHLYPELPPAPEWLDSRPGRTVYAELGESERVVPECAVVGRWNLCEQRKNAARVLEAFLPAKHVLKV